MNRRDLQILSQTRLLEARALLRAELPDGAYYLAGYAVECALKACIAKGTQRYDFPDRRSVEASHTHNLKDLIRVADLETARLEEALINPVFKNYWDVVQQWTEHSRYRRNNLDMARTLVEAAGNGKHGVIVWIKRHW